LFSCSFVDVNRETFTEIIKEMQSEIKSVMSGQKVEKGQSFMQLKTVFCNGKSMVILVYW